MAYVLKAIYKGYSWVFDDLADHRTDDWFLMQGPWYPAAIMLGYLYVVNKLGPAFMKNRPAYNLKYTLIAYNFIQIFLNCYILFKGIHMAPQVNWICSEVDYSDGPNSRLQLQLTYTYFWVKIIDLLETVFFILRKSMRQVSFLHVYHHFGMIFLTWTGTRFLAGGHGLFIGLFNIIVHIAMYCYYLVSALDARYKNNLWFKKQITHLQLIQFSILLVMFSGILIQPNCKYPKFGSAVMVSQNLFMFTLFGDFYYRTYIKKKPKTKTKTEISPEGKNDTKKTDSRRVALDNNFLFDMQEGLQIWNK